MDWIGWIVLGIVAVVLIYVLGQIYIARMALKRFDEMTDDD